MQLPFVRLNEEHNDLRAALHAGLDEVLDGDGLVLGRAVAEFEQQFASFCETKHAVGVGSGADALELGLRALGLGPGDEVIVPANSFFASASAVCCAGAKPVFCDVDEYGLMSVDKVEAVVTARTRAVMPVHLYGLPVDMDPLLRWAKKAGCAVIEDACQAHGARYRGQRTGGLGDLAAFSFYPTKNLGALGDAGAMTMGNEDLFEGACLWRNYGSRQKYVHSLAGRNSRLDTLQARFLLVKLASFETKLAQRKDVACRLLEGLAGLPLRLPVGREGSEHVYHLFVVRTESLAVREQLQTHLHDKGVTTLVHYPVPIHRQRPFAGGGQATLPNSEAWSETALSLPMYPSMSTKEGAYLIEQIHRFFGSRL